MSLKNLCFATCPRFFVFISIKHLRVLLVVLYLMQEMIWIINSWKLKRFIVMGRKTDYQLYKMNINFLSLPYLIILHVSFRIKTKSSRKA